jgi:MFS family permease
MAVFNHMFVAIFVLFTVRDLGLSAGVVGLVFSLGGVGFLIGSLTVKRLASALGLGPAMLLGMFATTAGWGAVALAQGSTMQMVVNLGTALICEGIGAGLFFLTYISLRQAITPELMLGRVIATMRWWRSPERRSGRLPAGRLGNSSVCAQR